MLEVTELDAGYGLIQALHGVSLEIRDGEIVAVVGANGAGKTTLLRAISGMLAPTRGDIRLEGQSILGLRADQIVRLGLGHVPERRELFASMTVMENLQLGAYSRQAEGIPGANGSTLERDLVRIWELFPILRSRQKQVAGTLSGGEQQMLAIARGLMAHPRVLLLDEPSLGLAPLLVDEVLKAVDRLRKLGSTILLVEQNAAGALQVADRAYVLEVGRVVMSGATEDLLADDRVRRAYLGQRIAPLRQPQRIIHQAVEDQGPQERRAGGPPRRERRGRAKERGYSMESTGDLGLDLNYTLPDDYFEERLGLPGDVILGIQDRWLPKAFSHAYEHSQFYRAKFDAAGLGPDSVSGLGDLSNLPFTTTDEIRPNPARGYTSSQYVSVERKDITAVHRSSGTTGAPKIFPYTGRDAARWAANVATVLWNSGLRKDDILLSPGLSREFTGSGGSYLGAIALGIAFIPITVGPGVSETILAHLTGRIQVDGKRIVLDPLLRANAIHCLPSFLPRLIEIFDEAGVEPEEIALTKICCGAEPSSDAVRMRVAERLGIWPRDDYGLGEFYGPGVASECDAGGCLHVLSDTYIAEVLDPETGQATPVGEMGELVLTSLHKEALPLFRYRTGDKLMALPPSCPCGMDHKRIGRVVGRIRADEIVIPGGVIINRTYLEEVLLPVDGVGYEYVVTMAENPKRKGSEQMYLAVEGAGGPGAANGDLAEVIARRFRMEYKYTPVVQILPMGAIPRSWGKAKRICPPEEYKALVSQYIEESS